MQQNAIEIKNLTVAYDKKTVLKEINLKIPTGKLVAIIGPNGAGKTTLIKTILSLIKPIEGEITFPILGENIKNKIAYVPQSDSIDWDFPTTVIDVVMMGRYGHLGLFKRVGTNEKELALKTLDQVGMKHYANKQIKKLSGGQQQRVFLARALVQEAQIYLLDEPFKGIDIQTQIIIIKLLKELKNQGKSVIVVHHDLNTVEEYFDWVTLVNFKIIANGTVEKIYTTENIKTTFANLQ